MPDKNTTNIHGDLNVTGDFVARDKHVTIIQKIFNIFKSDSETLEQRNRRILLNHVENAWIKGVLDASLHGAALLDLGIKQDPEAVTQYPWAIKKESTDETLPAGTSMLEIFDSIGMGRSLLILGAPGSGKTTMLLELARGLIARAREDSTQPIPVVFNLASWTEKLTLADWLAQELNNLYSVPRKTAPDWVKGNKLLLLLDGLDEVRRDSRAKCVEAINAFRKEHGLTSLAVCSRSQDYADLNAKLSFEGAIEVQPLTQTQIAEFFNRFGEEMAEIKQTLEKNRKLKELAETPLFLSMMIIAYRDKRIIDDLTVQSQSTRVNHLLNTYIEFMLNNPSRNPLFSFPKNQVLMFLNFLGKKLIKHNITNFRIELLHPELLENKKQRITYRVIFGSFFGVFGFISGFVLRPDYSLIGMSLGVIYSLLVTDKNDLVIALKWSSQSARKNQSMYFYFGLLLGVFFGLYVYFLFGVLWIGVLTWLASGLAFVLTGMFLNGIVENVIEKSSYPGQELRRSFIYSVVACIFFGGWGLITESWRGLIIGILFGWLISFGRALFQHYAMKLVFVLCENMPMKLVPFLDHCVDLIFLRRVGGGYIFVHRLLMEHFAEMYVETPTSKGN